MKKATISLATAVVLLAAPAAFAAAPQERDLGKIDILREARRPHPYAAQLNALVLSTMGPGTLWSGYRDPDDGRRYVGHDACRPCHWNRHRDWSATKMASSLKKLADFRGGMFLNDARCISCHTTGYDPGLENGGFDEGVDLMADVQCEACHGAGSLMVEKSDRAYIVNTPDGDLCGRCHSERYGTGACFPEWQEWRSSRHRQSMDTLRRSPQAQAGCLECHSAEAAVAAAGSGRAPGLEEASFGITCQACHDAMVRTFPELPDNNQLRRPKKELCQWCHSQRSKMPDGLPHAPQAEMLGGVGGAEFPRESYRSGPMNADLERGCLTCHSVSDRSIKYSYQGHAFLPNILACRRCHPDQQSFDRKAVQTTIRRLLRQLGDRLAEYPAGRREGEYYRMALFNYNFVLRDRSLGIHNSDYARKLLTDSLRYLGPASR